MAKALSFAGSGAGRHGRGLRGRRLEPGRQRAAVVAQADADVAVEQAVAVAVFGDQEQVAVEVTGLRVRRWDAQRLAKARAWVRASPVASATESSLADSHLLTRMAVADVSRIRPNPSACG